MVCRKTAFIHGLMSAERQGIDMLYIYMSEDTPNTPISEKVVFKAGFSKHPLIRGGQLKQAACRTIGQKVDMRVRNHYAPCNTDNRKEAEYIERYILRMIARRPSAVKLSPEFFSISTEDRAYCYKHLRLWIGTARQRMRKEGL